MDKLDKKALSLLDTVRPIKQEQIDTGIIPLNMVTGGGILRGDTIQYVGESGTGKSTLLLNLAGNLLQAGESVAYCDAEHGVKELENKADMLDNMGIKPYEDKEYKMGQPQFLRTEPFSFEELEELIETVILPVGYQHVILDSISTIKPLRLLEKSSEDHAVGIDSKAQTHFITKYKTMFRRNGVTFHFINHVRANFNATWGGSDSKPMGAKALKFLSDILIWIAPGAKLKKKENLFSGRDDAAFGNLCKLWTEKCRSERGLIKVPCPVVFGKGVSNPYFYFEMLKLNKYVKNAGAWKSIQIPGHGEIKGNGDIGFVQAIAKEREAVHEFLESKGHFTLIREVEED
jgi:RecA/RadA recombinase